MVEIEFTWEKKKEADHRRNYGFSRRRYLSGGLKKCSKLTYPHLIEFESFEDYKNDLEGKLAETIQTEMHIDPSLEKVKVEIYGTRDYFSAAQYTETSSDGKTVSLGFHLDSVVNNFYYNPKGNLTSFKIDVGHELLHHLDRRMLKRKDVVLSGIDVKKERALYHLVNYLAMVRTEGLAQSDPRTSFYLLTRIIGINAEGLARRTKKVDEVIDFLKKGAPEPRKEGDLFFPGNVMNWGYELDRLKKANNFSAYEQGNDMFSIIREAEMKKTGKNEFTHNEINNKVIQMYSFNEFYEYFYKCAREIALNEDQMIVRPEHANILLERERRAFAVKPIFKKINSNLELQLS